MSTVQQYFRLASVLIFSLPLLVSAQYTQINVASKVEQKGAQSQMVYVQSMDGMSTCALPLQYSGSISSLNAIQLDFSTCTSVLKNLSGKESFNEIEKTDTKYVYADNSNYSVRLRVLNNLLLIEKIISKKTDVKYTWNFSYNENLVVPEDVQKTTVPKSSETNRFDASSTEPTKPPVKQDVPKSNQKVSSSQTSTLQVDDKHYLIQKGDYIYKIARKVGCSPSYLLKINNIKESTVLYPGQTIIICKDGNYKFPESTASKGTSAVSAKSIDKIGGDIEKIKSEYEKLFTENTSLKTYAEELKQDFEEMVKEFDELKKSYESLTQEYKEMAKDNHALQKENERLRALLKEKNVDPENELTEEEKEHVEQLQEHIKGVRNQLEEMKKEIDDTREGNEEMKENAPKEGGSGTGSGSGTGVESIPSNKTGSLEEGDEMNNASVNADPSFIQICENILERCKKDEDLKRLLLDRKLIYTLQDDKVVEVKPLESELNKKSKLGKDKSPEDYVLGEDIFALMNLSYNFNGSANSEVKTNLYIDVERITYQAKISDKNIKFKKSSKKNLDELDGKHAHVKAIKETFKEENKKKGKYEIEVIDGQFNLEAEMANDHFNTLKKYSEIAVLSFD